MTTAAIRPMSLPRGLWEFCRPHTIVGTSLAVFTIYALAVAAAGRQDVTVLAGAYLASLAVNVYVVGLNQITDIEIDRINKPYLPLAAGTFSVGVAIWIVATTGALALVVAASLGRYIFETITLIFLLGTAYSAPPIRLKRFPFFAAATITTARALVLNIGLYLGYSQVLRGPEGVPPHVMLFVGFMLTFVIVIAIMKDIPDMAGDRDHHISTLPVRIGAARSLVLCKLILSAAYSALILAAMVGIKGVHPKLVLGTHAAALAAVWLRGSRVDADAKESIVSYYMFVWKLFYAEFVAFSAACLLA